jgi:hypothetical protein
VTVETGKAFADWLAGGAAQEPAASPLVETIRETIAKATTVKKLGAITDRLDALVSEDKITGDEWSALTDEVNARHDEIEPAAVSDK